MHEQKEEGKKPEMMMLWEKLGDNEKKVLMMRKLEGKIMKERAHDQTAAVQSRDPEDNQVVARKIENM